MHPGTRESQGDIYLFGMLFMTLYLCSWGTLCLDYLPKDKEITPIPLYGWFLAFYANGMIPAANTDETAKDTENKTRKRSRLGDVGEGNGTPLQYSCLENPRDGGAWWAAVYGVAQSQTRLKWLSSSSRGRQHGGQEASEKGRRKTFMEGRGNLGKSSVLEGNRREGFKEAVS